jgi:hypothetical protein
MASLISSSPATRTTRDELLKGLINDEEVERAMLTIVYEIRCSTVRTTTTATVAANTT